MTRGIALALAAWAVASAPAPAAAWNRLHARTFATLPAGTPAVEGIEVDAAGNVYATTFGFTADGPVSTPGQLVELDAAGRLIRQVTVENASPHLIGLAFHPGTGALLVIDFGAAKVLSVNPANGHSSEFMTLPATLPHAGGAGLNDLTFDRDGNVYVSDSFQGIVWKTSAAGGVASVWVDDALLRTSGVPPFGANGLRFNGAGTAMFVANTGNDTVVKIPVSGGVAGTPAVFANGINGADGLIMDDRDDLWVAANQADEIVVVDPTGRAIAKLGDFDGLSERGAPVGLLFPASLRFSRGRLLVTNLSLDLRVISPDFAAVDSQWAAAVTRNTIASLPATIPPVRSE